MKYLRTYECQGIRFVAWENQGKFYTLRNDKPRYMLTHGTAKAAIAHAESMWHNFAYLN
jgi:hypothetical protein